MADMLPIRTGSLPASADAAEGSWIEIDDPATLLSNPRYLARLQDARVVRIYRMVPCNMNLD